MNTLSSVPEVKLPETKLPDLEKLKSANSDRKKIHDSANEFEAIFLETVLKTMRQTIEKSGLVDGGNAEEIYRSMLDSEYAKTMAGQRNTGIADAIEAQMLSQAGLSQGLKQYSKIAK